MVLITLWYLSKRTNKRKKNSKWSIIHYLNLTEILQKIDLIPRANGLIDLKIYSFKSLCKFFWFFLKQCPIKILCCDWYLIRKSKREKTKRRRQEGSLTQSEICEWPNCSGHKQSYCYPAMREFKMRDTRRS